MCICISVAVVLHAKLNTGVAIDVLQIEDIRTQTRQEKKRLAMAMRQKQLKLLRMTANQQGQVVMSEGAGAVGAAELAALKEETGLTCSICREGYKYMPSKVQ